MSARAPRAHVRPCTCTHTHRLARAHTHMSLSPLTLTHVLQGHTSSHTCPHGNERGRKRAGQDGAGERAALLQAPVAEGDPSVQPPDAEAPARPSRLAAGARSTGSVLRGLGAAAH